MIMAQIKTKEKTISIEQKETFTELGKKCLLAIFIGEVLLSVFAKFFV